MDKTALITGAAHRIGADTTRLLHAHGYRVAVHFNRSAERAAALAAELNVVRADSACTVRGDLTDPETAPALVDAVVQAFGRLDVLVNNASIYEPSDIEAADVTRWDALMTTNVRAPYLLSTAAIEALRATAGSIINLTDVYGLRPQPGHVAYCTSKSALIGLTLAMARDLAPEIRVNGVSPGPIIWAQGDQPAYREEVLRKTPLGKLGATGDIAGAVVYLAEAPYVTGQILNIDGGRSIFI
ncbi:MAG: pteridine reductase [Gammaproteobacteria bacterium]|jgi:pteridine reductase